MKAYSKWISISYRHSQIYFSREFEKLGLSSGQYMFMLCICDYAGITQDALAEELAMNKSTVARVVAQLEHAEFIRRTINLKDKRIYNLYPTEKGIATYPKIKKVLDSWNSLITEDLTDEEDRLLESLLIRVQEKAIQYGKQNTEE